MCDMKFKDEIWLEIHVETHFSGTNQSQQPKQTPSEDNDDEIEMLGASAAVETNVAKTSGGRRSRTNSASSLAANVDENFEIDQMIILSECANNNTNSSDIMIVDDSVNNDNGKFVRQVFYSKIGSIQN